VKPTVRILATLALAAAALVGTAQAQFTPRNVECIAPAGAGGGWDFTCRQMANVLVQIGKVPGSIQTQNLTGGGGGVAFASVVANQTGNENLIVAASTATTSRIASGEFAGFSADDVRWVAALGADYGVLAVAVDSPYQSIDEVIAAWQADPRSVSVVGGSAVGGWDHLKVLLLADAAGIPVQPIRYTTFESGGAAVIEVVAGRADLFTGDISETLQFVEAGQLRVLVALSEERLPMLADVPTAIELGYDVVGPNWRGFYMPAGISDAAYDWWVEAFQVLGASAEWETLRVQNGIEPFYRYGAEMEAFAKDQVADIVQLLTEIGAR
jgi:putative tricarboxylic transport membrane protein